MKSIKYIYIQTFWVLSVVPEVKGQWTITVDWLAILSQKIDWRVNGSIGGGDLSASMINQTLGAKKALMHVTMEYDLCVWTVQLDV